jgi:hypothetical protein
VGTGAEVGYNVNRIARRSTARKEVQEMRRVWVRSVLLGLSLTLLVAGLATARELGRPPITTPPEPPAASLGLYITSEDNENNGGTGVADGDMGYASPDYVFAEDKEAPVEFNVVVGDEICSDGVLTLEGFLWEGGEVYLNGHLLGDAPDLDEEEWSAAQFDVPLASLKPGANLVQLLIEEGASAVIAWGTLAIEPCAVEFVPEPGSMVLFASGVAGLAGYVALRLRSGESLSRRTRE